MLSVIKSFTAPVCSVSICLLACIWLTGQSRGADSYLTSHQIQQALEPLAKAHAGEVAVSVQVLDEAGKTIVQWNLHGDRVMPTASLIKLPVMIEAYRQAAAGTIDLNSMLTLKDGDKVPGSGILTEHFSAGLQLPMRDAIRLMIRYSDNTATNLVIDQIGIAATARTMSEWGFPETQLHSQVYRRETSVALPRSERYGLGSTTANDMTELLVRLERGELISPQASQEMLGHLYTCDDTHKLTRDLPSDCRVAHKTGSVSRSRTAAGIIHTPTGKFALCVLTDKNEDSSWSSENAADKLIGSMARRVYDLLSPASLSPEASQAPDSAVSATSSAANLSAQATPLSEPNISVHALPLSSPLDPSAPPAVSAKAWAVLDAASGELLSQGNGQERLPNASTTKVMTALLVLELAATDPSVLDELITFSNRADETLGSTADVRAGESLTAGELLYGLLLPSGNDASVAFAEHFGSRLASRQPQEQAAEISTAPAEHPQPEKAGDLQAVNAPAADESYTQFVAAMNARARELGLSQTHFANPNGLTATDHFSSAHDLARLARVALQHPRMREIIRCRQYSATVRGSDGQTRDLVWENTNRLLEQAGFSGMKTGTTDAAGACLIAVGESSQASVDGRAQNQRPEERPGGRETIVVVLGCSSSEARYIDARNLFAWAWRL